MDIVNLEKQTDEIDTNDCRIDSGAERNAENDINLFNTASSLNETSHECQKLLEMKTKEILKPVPAPERKCKLTVPTGLTTSSSSPELLNNLSYYPLNVGRKQEINNVKHDNKVGLSDDKPNLEMATDPSFLKTTPTDKDKKADRSPSDRRRTGTINLPKLVMPNSPGNEDLPQQPERSHETIVENPMSAGLPDNVVEPDDGKSDPEKGSVESPSTPETAELMDDSSQSKTSVTKQVLTTAVSNSESNPSFITMTNSSCELSSSPQSSPGIEGFSRPRTFSASTPVAPKRVQKPSVDKPNANVMPSTPQSLRKHRKDENFVSNSLSNTPNTGITKNKLLDKVRRKNFSTNTNQIPPRRKTSADSLGSHQSLSRKLSEPDTKKGNTSPSWQKRLSQLFVPPSMEELNADETCTLMPDEGGLPSALQSHHGSRRSSKTADSLSKQSGKRRKRRKSVTKNPLDRDDQDRLEMLDKLENTDDLSDGDSGNNEDDDSSSDYTDDETKGMVGRRSESFPLVKADKAQPTIVRMESQGETSFDDTICSNRSSYFKHFYNLRPGMPQARSTQSRVAWQHTSIASLINEKEQPDELEEGKKRKPPLDYPQLMLSLVLFLVICVMVSLIFYFYRLHIMSVFIFNRIKIVEKTRNLEVLNINDENISTTPLVIVRLGVDFPLNARHTDCTHYLKYLLDVRGDINKYRLARKRRSIENLGNRSEIIGTDVTLTNLHPVLANSERVINQTDKVKRRKNGKSRLTSSEKNITSHPAMPSIDQDVITPGIKIGSEQPFIAGRNKTKKRNGNRSNNTVAKNEFDVKATVQADEVVTLSIFSVEDTTKIAVISEQPRKIESSEEIESANSRETSDEGLSNAIEGNSYREVKKSIEAGAKTDDLQSSENSMNLPGNVRESDDKIKPAIVHTSNDTSLHNETLSSTQIAGTVTGIKKALEQNKLTSTNSATTNGRRRFSEIRDTQTYQGLVDKIIHGEPHNINEFVDPRIEEAVKGTVNPRFILPRRRKIWKSPEGDAAEEAVPEENFDFVQPVPVEDLDFFEAALADREGIEDEFSEMQCIDYKGNGRLQLTQRPPIGEVDCFSVHWESSNSNVQMKDCFIMDNNATGAWWGMGDITGGSLPLSKLGKLEATPLYSGEIQRHVVGGLIRRVWISSKGILVSVPLASNTVFSVNAIKKNESEFCLSSEKSIDVNHPNEKHNPILDYTVCTGPNVTSILGSLREVERMNEVEYQSSKWRKSQHHIDLSLPSPEAPPEITEALVEEVQERFNCPVWRPWLSHDEGAIDQDDVVAYAEEIAASSFDTCGHVLLPVTWQNIIGDLDFDQRRFPNPKLMIETLMRKGLRVALSLSPMIDTETQRFKNSSVTDLLVRQVNSTLPILVSTHRATVAGVLDFTNPNTIEWYASELKKLQEKYVIDRFHVSPINTQSLPPFRQQYTPHLNPDYALGQFIKAVAQIRPPISTDVAIIPVNAPTFLLAGYGDASWEMLEMLPNRILSISSVGGILVDSGVIGGWSNQKGHIPSRELYIRWMAVSMFFPAMQLSVLPGMYDPMVETHANYLQNLRKQFVIPRFNENLPEALRNGYPLVSPLAIAFPKDTKSLSIGDQWMVGRDMMVAPVLQRGRRARDIYLPPGIWKDGIDDRLLKGKRWLKNYVVSIGKVPYFFLMKPERGNKGTKQKDANQKQPRYQ